MVTALEYFIEFERTVREDERRKNSKLLSSPTFDMLMKVLVSQRQQGSTSALAGIAKINPKALIVTDTYRMAGCISNGHGLERTQVTHLAGLLNSTVGREKGPLLFDLTAVMELMRTIKREVENGTTTSR